LLECYAECSLSYAKITQTSAESSSLLECYVECSLSYAKITQIFEQKKRGWQKSAPRSERDKTGLATNHLIYRF